MTDLYFIGFTGSWHGATYVNETRERPAPTTFLGAVEAVTEGILEHPGVETFRVLHIMQGGTWYDVTDVLRDAIRSTAEDEANRFLLEHPAINPDGFCFDCWQSSRPRCPGGAADHAYMEAAE